MFKPSLCEEHYDVVRTLEKQNSDRSKVVQRLAEGKRIIEIILPIDTPKPEEKMGHMAKISTRNITNKFIKAGRIKKTSCEVCGTTENVQTHHLDYKDPLKVQFLCKEHHREWHRNNKT